MVRNAPPRGSQRRRAQLGVGDWVSCSGDGRRDGRRRCSVGRRRRVQALQERGAGSSGRAAADATGWVAHLLDAVHVSRTHEAADACNHSKRYALYGSRPGRRLGFKAAAGVRVEMLGEGFGVGSKPGSGARVGVEGAPVCSLLLAPYVSPSPRQQLSSPNRITGQRAHVNPHRNQSTIKPAEGVGGTDMAIFLDA